jgi:membrane protein, antimicrobial resistance system
MAMPEMTSEKQGTGTSMNFVSRFVGIFHSPKRVFSDVDAGAPWWQPLIWALLLTLIIGYIAMPVQVQLLRLRADQMSEEQIEQAVKYVPVGLVVTLLMVVIAGFVVAGVSYIVVSLLSERATFRKHLAIYFYASIVVSLGLLISNLVVRTKGIDSIRTARDASASFGPAAFVPEGQKILYAILSTFDIFSVWFYALMILGVMHVFRVSWRSALLVVIPIWLFSVVFAIIGAHFGGAV